MVIVSWRGKAVSKNKRYRFAYDRKSGKTKLVKTKEYNSWLNSLGWTIKAQIQKRYKAFQWILINATLNGASDHHNLVDVVLDALQRCGLIRNDRDVGIVTSMPCETHKRGEQDEIRLFIQPGEEEEYYASMPARVAKRGDKLRVVEPSGKLVRNNKGTPVDGGGHGSKAKAQKQARAINSKRR